jgi:hypothetical protein
MKHTAAQALVTIAIAAAIVLAVKVSQARAQSHQTPMYDKDGRYCGSVFDYGKTQTYTDRNGHFSGSAINNNKRHHIVLQPQRPVLRLSWFVDRPSLQLQEIGPLP